MKIEWNNCLRIDRDDDLAVSLATMKTHLSMSSINDDDALIRELIGAATDYIEGPDGVGIALLKQTYTAELKNLPALVEIPLAPLISVTATVDGQTIQPNHVNLALGEAEFSPMQGRATVVFTVGYADTDDIPLKLRQAIKMLVASWYRHRENDGETNLSEIPHGVTRILSQVRRY